MFLEKFFWHFDKKYLTFYSHSAIIVKQSVGTHGHKCRNGGIGRRPGLKIPWDFFSYRFDPGFRHHYIAEWSSLAARRAHNPKVMRFKSHLRNQRLVKTSLLFLPLAKMVRDEMWTSRASLYDLSIQALRAQNAVGIYACRLRRQHTASFCVSDRKIADNHYPVIKSHLRNQRLVKNEPSFFANGKNGARWDMNLMPSVFWTGFVAIKSASPSSNESFK